MQITRVLFIAFAAIGVSADRAWSQASTADYPNRQVNLVVPFAPGGSTDILGRLIGQKLSDRFGKPFVVENRPGAGTVTAAVQVAKTPARWLHHHDGDERDHGDEYDALQEAAL